MVVACLAALLLATAACGPVRLDSRPQIRGTIVAVERGTLGIRHKTGRTYHVTITHNTRVVHDRQPEERALCPGQRATVYLAQPGAFTASSVTVWSGRCDTPENPITEK
jgi:hypothetical protein